MSAANVKQQYRYRELLPWLIGVLRNGNETLMKLWLSGRLWLLIKEGDNDD